MNKDYFVKQLMTFAEEYKIEVSEELVGDIVSLASFRVVKKGEILASIGDDTNCAGLILSGVARAYYIDNDGNDITRGFAQEEGISKTYSNLSWYHTGVSFQDQRRNEGRSNRRIKRSCFISFVTTALLKISRVILLRRGIRAG